MNSEKVAGILGAIVASAVLVIAIVYGPIGQIGKPQKPVQRSSSRPAGRRRAARREGTGGTGGAAVIGTAQPAPLRNAADHPYLGFNGDVDAS